MVQIYLMLYDEEYTIRFFFISAPIFPVNPEAAVSNVIPKSASVLLKAVAEIMDSPDLFGP